MIELLIKEQRLIIVKHIIKSLIALEKIGGERDNVFIDEIMNCIDNYMPEIAKEINN